MSKEVIAKIASLKEKEEALLKKRITEPSSKLTVMLKDVKNRLKELRHELGYYK